MTVQSIDKRVATEANMTSASQTSQQGVTSVEDAFMSLLQQATQRFSNTAASSVSPDSVLADHFANMQAESQVNAAQPVQPAQKPDRPVATKDQRTAARADKPRQSQDKSQAAQSSDDNAPAAAPAAADNQPAAADAPQAQTAQTGNQAATQTDAQQQAVQSQVAAVIAQPQQQVIEIDVTVTETVQISETASSGQSAQAALTDPKQALQQIVAQMSQAAGGQTQAATQDPLAGLSKDDRQRITDLQNKIVGDLQKGDAEDALAAATQLVAQLVAKAGQHTVATLNTAQAQSGPQTDAAQAQAQDLGAMLAGTNAQVAIKVQVTETVATTQTPAADTGTEILAQLDIAVQGQATAQDPNQNAAGQNGQSAQSDSLAMPVPVVSGADAAQNAAAADEAKTFSAVLAAQIEATTQVNEAAPEPQPVAAMAAVTSTQAADKPAASQQAQGPRAPRVPLQQQVMDQVSVQIDKAVKDGNDTVKIQLKPYELGKIEVKLEVASDGKVTATVTAEKPETLALLQKDSKGLEKALEDAGLKPDANSTSFSLRGGDQQQNANQGNSSSRQGRKSARGGSSDDDAVPLAGAVSASQTRSGLGGRSGVDISV